MYMLKSRQGEALSARSDSARNDEMGLMAAAHNLMIVAIIKVFYRATPTPFSLPCSRDHQGPCVKPIRPLV